MIQNDMNNALLTAAIAGTLVKLNKDLEKQGFKDLDELDQTIAKIELEIAIAKDEERPYANKIKLLKKYKRIKAEYLEKKAELEEKQKRNTIISIAVSAVLIVVSIIVAMSVIMNI